MRDAAAAASSDDLQRIAAALEQINKRAVVSPADRAALLGAIASCGGSSSSAKGDGVGDNDPIAHLGHALLQAGGQAAPAPAVAPAAAPAGKRKKSDPPDGAAVVDADGDEVLE